MITARPACCLYETAQAAERVDFTGCERRREKVRPARCRVCSSGKKENEKVYRQRRMPANARAILPKFLIAVRPFFGQAAQLHAANMQIHSRGCVFVKPADSGLRQQILSTGNMVADARK